MISNCILCAKRRAAHFLSLKEPAVHPQISHDMYRYYNLYITWIPFAQGIWIVFQGVLFQGIPTVWILFQLLPNVWILFQGSLHDSSLFQGSSSWFLHGGLSNTWTQKLLNQKICRHIFHLFLFTCLSIAFSSKNAKLSF